MGISPLSFTGISSFSADFQTILNRSQTIAEFPLRNLQNQRTDLLQRKTLTTTLQGLVTSFSSSLENLGKVGSARGLGGSSSNSSKVAVGLVTADTPATYTLSDITSVARSASETSLTGYADGASISPSGKVKLTVGTTTYDITLGSGENTLAGLRSKINALGAGVTATIFTTGTGATPNYLSVSADATGAKVLKLEEDPDGTPTDLLTAANQGANAEFKLNGVSVSRASNNVNDVIAGLTFTVKETTAGSETVRLTIASDRAQLRTALSSITSAYNSLVDFIDSQVGEAAGLLSGSSLVGQTSNALRRFTNVNGTGTIKTLTQLGLELGKDGKLTFTGNTFDALTDAQVLSGFDYVNDKTGVGTLKSVFASIGDPVTGLIKLDQDQSDRSDTRLQNAITTLNERIVAQQATLRLRLSQADTLLATLENQRKSVTASLDGLNLTLYGRSNG
jgi:flagellar hook-associated protein 2